MKINEHIDDPNQPINVLADESSLNLQGATAQADPETPGVWKVNLPAEDGIYAIVYLKGFAGRTEDDFEVVEM